MAVPKGRPTGSPSIAEEVINVTVTNDASGNPQTVTEFFESGATRVTNFSYETAV